MSDLRSGRIDGYSVPGLALSAEYRRLQTDLHDFNGTVSQGNLAGAIIGTATARFNADYVNDAILFRVRYNFGMAGYRPPSERTSCGT